MASDPGATYRNSPSPGTTLRQEDSWISPSPPTSTSGHSTLEWGGSVHQKGRVSKCREQIERGKSHVATLTHDQSRHSKRTERCSLSRSIARARQRQLGQHGVQRKAVVSTRPGIRVSGLVQRTPGMCCSLLYMGASVHHRDTLPL